jgi:hypothetical protein
VKAALAISAVSLALLLGFALWVLSTRTEVDRNACRSVNDLKHVLVTLVDRGDANLRKYKDEGLITTEQLRRSLRQSVKAREDLAPDICR